MKAKDLLSMQTMVQTLGTRELRLWTQMVLSLTTIQQQQTHWMITRRVSFTPTANDGVYGTAVGSYVKIGSQVTVSGYVSTPSVTTGSTVIKIRSLPFPIVLSGHYSNGTGLYRYLSVSANYEMVLYVSGSDIEVWQSGTGNYSQLDHSDFNNSAAQIFFTLTYKTNS